MRLHRFYIPPKTAKLSHDFWLHDEQILHQWTRVLRYKPGDEVVLFDAVENERLYEIIEINKEGVHLSYKTDFKRKLPKKNIYVFWSLLKKDKNDWILQKCTELGVRHFVPIIADRSEKTGFNLERAQKILIEAAEQCGRSDIPRITEPTMLQSAISTYKDNVSLFVAEQNSESAPNTLKDIEDAGVFIGPEGGWTDAEISLFETDKIQALLLADYTLRAETACIVAATKLLQ